MKDEEEAMIGRKERALIFRRARTHSLLGNSLSPRVLISSRTARLALRRIRNRQRRLTTWVRATVQARRQSAHTAIVRHPEFTWITHPVKSFSSETVLTEHLSIVENALQAAGIEYVILSAEPNKRRVIAVSHDHASRLRSALSSHLRGGAVYCATVRGTRVQTPRLIGHETVPAKAQRLRIFRALSSESGTLLSTHHLGCDVEFWVERHEDAVGPAGETLPAGTWTPPTGNRWTAFLQPENRGPAYRPVDGALRPVPAAFTAPHALTTVQPIDAVYTWVDGSDPDWVLRKEARLQSLDHGPSSPFSTNTSRFVSRDELRYSLRSLEMYGGWIRHVYVVTDGQVPDWLNVDHPDLTLVSHDELFDDPEHLPTFNSHAIETRLHRIDGLSEHFIYFNDDVFLGRPISPEQFVLSNGTSQFFISSEKLDLGPVAPSDFPAMAAGKNNRELIQRHFGRQITNKIRHVPHSLRRSVMDDLEKAFPDAIHATAASPFRSHTDVSVTSSLAHYYGYFTGRAVPGQIRSEYIDIHRRDLRRRLDRLRDRRDLDAFCLNEHDATSSDHESQTQVVHEFLLSYFPTPSRFEIT